MKRITAILSLAAFLRLFSLEVASAQEVLDWSSSKYFQFNIGTVLLKVDAAGARTIEADISVTDPTTGKIWDIKNDDPFRHLPSASRLALDIGWSTSDYGNTGAAGDPLQTLPFGKGFGTALPISVDILKTSVPLGNGWFRVSSLLPAQAQGTAAVVFEGHPASLVQQNGVMVEARVPVKTVYKYLKLTGTTLVARREVVDINKCKKCHDGNIHGDTVVPRLSLHGANRTEEIRACVVCHNPNQTDIPYRTSGSETPIDFKTMVHSIHAGKMREEPFIVTGFRGTLYDFSHVVFPNKLRNCLNCHIDVNGKGTFELPLGANVRGTTIISGSVPGVSVDINPANDRKITPTAAVCSSCHDKGEDSSHMMSKGASFNTTQAAIDSGTVKERCKDCHGPGRYKDVRKMHEIRSSR